jgi:hypothetical protein
MSTWEVFCAICGGSSTSYVEVGSRDPEALKRRREEVRKQQQKMEEGRLYQYFCERSIADPRDNEDEDEDGGHSADSGYDPTLVAEDTSWLHSMRCLGLTEDDSGYSKSVSCSCSSWGADIDWPSAEHGFQAEDKSRTLCVFLPLLFFYLNILVLMNR